MDGERIVTTSTQTSLADILLQRATTDANEAIVYQIGREAPFSVDGADLLERAQRAAAAIRANGVAPGDRVLLMMTSQADFVDAFFGAIWADAIPVPLFPPIFSRQPEDFIANFSEIAKNSGAKLMVATDENVEAMDHFAERLGGGFRILPRSAWNDDGERLEKEPQRKLSDLALLQYTSGSTGTPKGVALSHANVIANMAAIRRGIKVSREETSVSWLPLYHDMGLIGLLTSFYSGGRMIVLSPLEFAKNPVTWLRAISEYGATLSPAPNFAFRRCMQLSDEILDGIDLSSWRVALNGAEPVCPDTAHEFSARFASYGFRSSAFYPVYGLAEHTLAVSFPALGAEPCIDTVDRSVLAATQLAETVPLDHEDSMRFVSVGKPLQGVSIEIRDTDNVPLPDSHVGEILVKSASVMTGYFENEAATAAVMSDGWLKTGDLGYLKSGMLYITGRIKDIIIRAGRNYYPHDFESAASSVPGVRAGRVAAFSIAVDKEDDHVVILAESSASEEEQRNKLVQSIAESVAARIGFRPERIELCKRGVLPMTSSGKVRRRVARERFLSGDLCTTCG